MKFFWSLLVAMASLSILLTSAAPIKENNPDDYREQLIEKAEQVICETKDFLAKHKDSENYSDKICMIRELEDMEVLVEEIKMTRNEHRLHLLEHILEQHEKHLEETMKHFNDHNPTTQQP